MPRFCVNNNAQPAGENEVHNLDANCGHLPLPANRISMGNHASCHGAVIAARKLYSNVDGCAYCAYECHAR